MSVKLRKMTTPNNLIRPATLNVEPNPTLPPVSSQGPSHQLPSGNNDRGRNPEILERTIAGIVNRILQSECRNIVQNIINPNADQFSGVDQHIDPRYENNLSELDKIPDVVRCLKDFSGIPGEFNSWKKSVDRILKLYENSKGTPKYFGILSVVRNKIVGQADVVLESYNTPLDWKCIARCLTMHYADKRDLSTLEYQMTSLVQGHQTIQEFYHSVYSHLSLILNKIGCMDVTNESITLLAQTYRDKALDTFVRGLKGDLPRLLGIREPSDLPQALHLCLKLENQSYRTQYANSHQGPSRAVHNQVVPPLLSRRPVANQNKVNFNRGNQPFYPQLAYSPQPQANFNPYRPQNSYRPPPFNQGNVRNQGPHQAGPSRPLAPKPLPRPEPMDVDQSIQTKNVNYMNRPTQGQFYGKRPPSSAQVPNLANKYQRSYHIEPQETTINNYEQTQGLGSAASFEQPFADQTQYVEYNQGNEPDEQDYTDISGSGASSEQPFADQVQYAEYNQGYEPDEQDHTVIHFLD